MSYNKTHRIALTALLLSGIMLCSCRKDSIITGNPGQDGLSAPDTEHPLALNPLPFSDTDEAASPGTRGEAPVTDISISSMGVFAGYREKGDFSDDTRSNDYINNSMYYLVSSTGTWQWNFPTYWPIAGRLSIFAYSPYDATLNLRDDTGYPSFRYTPLSEVRHQVDFCVAEPKLNMSKTDEAIPLHFRHTMAGILINMNYTGTLPLAEYYVKVDRIALNGLIGTKELVFLPEDPHFSWEEYTASTKTATYELKRTKDAFETQIKDVELPKKDADNTNHIHVNPDGGALYLLPQTTDAATISVTYGYYQANGTGETMMMRFESTSELPAATWEAGKYTKYKMTLDIGHASILRITVEEGGTMIEPYITAQETAEDHKVE